jgi:hypothetical protein
MHKHVEEKSLFQPDSRFPYKEVTLNIEATALVSEATICYGTLAYIINTSKTSNLQSSFGIYIG